MTQKILLLILLLLFSEIVLSQTNDIIFENIYAKADSNNEKIKILIDSSNNCIYSEPSMSMVYLEEAINLSEQIASDSVMCEIYYNYSIAQNYNSDYLAAIESLNLALEYANCLDSYKINMKINNLYGTIYKNIGFFDQANKYYFAALDIIEKNNLDEKGIVLNNIGSVYSYIKDYSKAIEYFKKSAKFIFDAEKLNLINYNIASCYEVIGRVDSAKIYFEGVLKYTEISFRNDLRISTLINLSAIYLDNNNFSESIRLCLEAEDIAVSNNFSSKLFLVYYQFANIYYHKANFSKALLYINDAKKHINVAVDIRNAKKLYYLQSKIGTTGFRVRKICILLTVRLLVISKKTKKINEIYEHNNL